MALAIWLYLVCGARRLLAVRASATTGSPRAPCRLAAGRGRGPGAQRGGRASARCIGSLLRQDYPGDSSIILVDDDSSDGTADVARAPRRPRNAGAIACT